MNAIVVPIAPIFAMRTRLPPSSHTPTSGRTIIPDRPMAPTTTPMTHGG